MSRHTWNRKGRERRLSEALFPHPYKCLLCNLGGGLCEVMVTHIQHLVQSPAHSRPLIIRLPYLSSYPKAEGETSEAFSGEEGGETHGGSLWLVRSGPSTVPTGKDLKVPVMAGGIPPIQTPSPLLLTTLPSQASALCVLVLGLLLSASLLSALPHPVFFPVLHTCPAACGSCSL